MPKPRKSKTGEQPSSQVNLYTQASLAENTYRSYRADLKHFKAAGGTIPCTAVHLAEYLASHATTMAVATLQHRIIAIHRAHLDTGQPSPAMDPLVRRTMQGIRRTRGTAQRRVLPAGERVQEQLDRRHPGVVRGEAEREGRLQVGPGRLELLERDVLAGRLGPVRGRGRGHARAPGGPPARGPRTAAPDASRCMGTGCLPGGPLRQQASQAVRAGCGSGGVR